MDTLGPDGKKLVVGRDIRLNGAISSCDCLVVEGTVEANLSETRTIIVAKGGAFSGVATVANAEISGLFEGELIASDTVTVRPGGIVRGAIHSANLVSERGAVIEGTLAVLARKAEPVRALIGHADTPEAVG
jgi:cytoskeletal protein CcmA (bactofilin family)